MIQQQLYTRSSRGLFIGQAGFDTVRKSDSLTKNDAKHYESNYTYNGKNIKGVNKDLPVISRRVLDDGNIMLDLAKSRQYKDFDGYKFVFISHAYIIPKDDICFAKHCKDVRQIAGVTDFIINHNDGDNSPLPEISELPFEQDYDEEKCVEFGLEGNDLTFFKKVISAVMQSAISGKRVYLVTSKIADAYTSLDFLKAIYYFIPLALRNKIGYTTVLNEQSMPNGINIAFVSSAHLDDIMDKRLFGANIDTHYCFDMDSQSVIFDGDGTINDSTDYLRFVEQNYSCLNYIKSSLRYFDKKANSAISLEDYNILARITLDEYQNDMSKYLDLYLNIVNRFGNDTALYQNMEECISQTAKEKQGNLSISDLMSINSVYHTLDEMSYGHINEIVSKSIEVSANNGNKQEFLQKFDVFDSNTAVSSAILKQYIVNNEYAIAFYYDRYFKKFVSCNDLLNYIVRIENEDYAITTGLVSRNAFVGAVNDRLLALTQQNISLDLCVDISVVSLRIKSAKLRQSIDAFVGEAVSDFIQSKRGDITKYTIRDFNLLDMHLSRYVSDMGFFRLIGQYILPLYNRSGERNIDIVNSFFGVETADLILARQFFINYYQNNRVKNDFLSYTFSFYSHRQRELDLAGAYKNLNSVAEITKYTRWLVANFMYLHPSNSIGIGTQYPNITDRYIALLDIILVTVADLQGDAALKKSDYSEYRDALEKYLYLNVPSLDDCYDVFCKKLKTAFVKGKVKSSMSQELFSPANSKSGIFGKKKKDKNKDGTDED